MLSSINIVEHELYFFVSCPGEILEGKKEQKKEQKSIKDVEFCKLWFTTLSTGFTFQLAAAEEGLYRELLLLPYSHQVPKDCIT